MNVYKSLLYRQVNSIYATLKWRSQLAGVYLRAWLHWQRLSKIILIGITGSAGKTTTKDLCHLIFSSFYSVASNRDTLNDTMAIGRTVLEVNRQHQFCILEIGAFKPGALDWPMRLFKPKIGVLTCIQRDHVREFKGKGIDGIAAEKAKLIEALPEDGVAVLNTDDARVKAIGERCRANIIWVGSSENATLRLLSATSRYPEPLILKVEYQGKVYEVVTGLHGKQLASSVLCALGVSLAAGLTLEQAIPQLALALPSEGRMQPVVLEEGITFIRDDFKAPLWSLHLPLDFLREATASRKIIVVGNLTHFSGKDSQVYKRVAGEMRQFSDIVVFVGQNAHRALRARSNDEDLALQGFSTMREAAAYLREMLRPGDLVLLKGSNKVDHLERLVFDRQKPIECWRERCGFERFCDTCSRLYQMAPDNNPTQEISQAGAGRLAGKWPTPSMDQVVPVIVGLGNPGEKYQDTLHNIGYRVLDSLVERFQGDWQAMDIGDICQISLDGRAVQLFRADAYMNETGPKLQQYLEKVGCLPAHCLIVCDDLDIEFGKLRFKRDGGDAGHRGVKSCLMALGTHAVPRLRLGVREIGKSGKAKEYVQTHLTKEAQSQLPRLMDEAIEIICKNLPEMISQSSRM